MEFLPLIARRSLLVPLAGVVLLLALGCGIQRGKFTTSGGGAECLLSPGAGLIDIIEGNYQRPAGRNAPQPILYIIIFCPGVKTGPSGSEIDYGTFVSSFVYTWGVPAAFSVGVGWDREMDTVSVAGRTFRREEGNVFVIRREPDGRFRCQQLPSLRHTLDCQTVLRYVKSQLPQDPAVAALTVVEE